MATSQNGWPASPDRRAIGVGEFRIAGVSFPGGVRIGWVSEVLGYVAREFHARVEPLVDGWCWGHAYRPVSGSTGLSNHASGTAIDCNAPRHPIGQAGTFTAGQTGTIRRIVAEVGGGVVRWGGDYSGRRDEMHFEINAGVAAVAAAAARLSQEDDMSENPWAYKNINVSPKDAFGLLFEASKNPWAYKNTAVDPRDAFGMLNAVVRDVADIKTLLSEINAKL